MYSESDIDGSVAACVLTPANAAAFRDHVASDRNAPAVGEEQFRLLTGFNDIFVSIAIILLLVAVSWIGSTVANIVAAAAVAASAWFLAEYFTRQRRMALPSIVLLIAFVGGVAATPITLLIDNRDVMDGWIKSITASDNGQIAIVSLIGAMIAAITGAAAWLHWRRFTVPITIAAAAISVIGIVVSLILGFVPPTRQAIYPMLTVAGVAMFAFAMYWDMSDLERRTRRSDVAFWLHLAAAPMIAHALFNLLGVFSENVDVARALIVLALYVAFAFIALVVDRRALLVSSLVYVLYALYALFERAGIVELSAAFTALVIGSALLLLSAFWQPMRRRIVTLLGDDVARRLPPTRLAV